VTQKNVSTVAKEQLAPFGPIHPSDVGHPGRRSAHPSGIQTGVSRIEPGDIPVMMRRNQNRILGTKTVSVSCEVLM